MPLSHCHLLNLVCKEPHMYLIIDVLSGYSKCAYCPQAHARSILSCSQCLGQDQELLPFVAHAFCALWADQGVRAATARGHVFELNDSAP